MSTKSEIEEAEPPANQQGGQQIVQQFNTEDHGLLREINNIQDNLSHMSSLVKQEGAEQLVQQFNIKDHALLREIKKMQDNLSHMKSLLKLNKTLSQSQQQQKSLKGRLELSALDKKILDARAMENLQVSYDYLQRPNLKYCLVFLSIFPENAVLRKRPLIYWWIGESLISTEKEGEEIFEELLKLELIIPYGNGKNPFMSKCKIHPWIRYLLIFLAKDAGLLNFDSEGVPRFDIISSRRACLLTDDKIFPMTEQDNLWERFRKFDETINLRTISNEPIPDLRTFFIGLRTISFESIRELRILFNESIRGLRTIFNVNQSYVSFKSELLGNQEKLAVLMLGRWQDLSTHHIEVENEQWLKELRTRKHLKYLSLRGISRITALPDSILELTCLEILDLKACHNLETLPDDISPLEKLTHLDVSECYLLESMPKGLDKLTSLQVLKGFVIANSKKTPCRIHDLIKLEKLMRLSIHIGSEAVIQPGEFQKLEDLKSVTHLKISWGKVVKVPLLFPPMLDKLDFEGFPYDKLPDWFKPSNLKELKKLYIKGGELSGLYHEKEGTWKVEILRLHYLKKLKFEEENFKNFFPSLRYVQEISWDKENKGEIKHFEWSEKD